MQDCTSPNLDKPGQLEPSTDNATIIPAAAAGAIFKASKPFIDDITATHTLPQPPLTSETISPIKKKLGKKPRYNLRTFITAGLWARFSNLKPDIALACVNNVCNDPASNAGAAGEEGTLIQATFNRRFKVLMGEDHFQNIKTI